MEKNLPVITSFGPISSRPVPKGATPSNPFRIEAQMGEDRVVLSLSPTAVLELRAELDLYLQAGGSR